MGFLLSFGFILRKKRVCMSVLVDSPPLPTNKKSRYMLARVATKLIRRLRRM